MGERERGGSTEIRFAPSVQKSPEANRRDILSASQQRGDGWASESLLCFCPYRLRMFHSILTIHFNCPIHMIKPFSH